MSIELQEARKKLDILEKLTNNPELILTDLFSNSVSDNNFLYQVNVNGRYILDYLVDYLKTLDVFNDSFIKLQSHDIHIYIPSLKYGEYQNLQSDDKIMKIDIDNRTYRLCYESIEKYTDTMSKEYKLEICELSDFWKKYENFGFKNRVKNAFMSLTTDKKLHIRLWDFIYILIVSKKKVNAALNREREKVNRKNERNLKYYNEHVDLQNFYKENAPMQIDMIHKKQKEIITFLNQIGYKEEPEMYEY